MNGSVQDEVKKPGLARQAVPFALAALILGYMFYQVDFRAVLLAFPRDTGSQALIILAYLAYCAVYFITDILSFHFVYNRFNTAIGMAEAARLRMASYLVQAVNAALTEIMSVLYMKRVKKVPALESTSSAAFVYFNETYTMFFFLSYCAFFLPAENRVQVMIPVIEIGFWPLFQGLMIAVWIVAPLWLLFWNGGIAKKFPGIYNARALMAFRQARLRDYGVTFAYRFGNNLVNIGANIVILRAMGINAPAALLFAAVPVMVNVAYWPVSVGGFGGTQLAAYFLLRGYASEETVLAYSLIWSGLFFLTRTLAGLPFLRPVYQAAFSPRLSGKE